MSSYWFSRRTNPSLIRASLSRRVRIDWTRRLLARRLLKSWTLTWINCKMNFDVLDFLKIICCCWMFEHQLNALLCCCLSFSFWTVLVDCIKILFIIYTDHATNEEVQHAIGPHDLLTMLKRRKLQWYGHVSCSLGLAKTILQGTIKGARRQDRQKKTWEDNIREWTGLEFAKSQRAVENRENGGNCLWRCVVSCGSTSFPWLVLFFGALLWGSMIHKHTGKWMWQRSASVIS